MAFKVQRFDLLVSLGSLALLGYFAWHAWQGPRGFWYLAQLHATQAQFEQELAGEMDVLSGLESKVKLMRPESVDPDMLEELARTELEMSRRNELIVRLQN